MQHFGDVASRVAIHPCRLPAAPPAPCCPTRRGSTSAAPFYLHDAADGYKVKPMQAAMMQRRLDEGKVQYELLEASGNGPQGGNTSVECHALRLPYHGAAPAC